MSRKIEIHDHARFDTIDIAYFIADESLAASDRFVEAVDEAVHELAEMPGMGVSREYRNPALKGLRMWPVPGFRNYLIFYRATDTLLYVCRVLHGARDIESLFAPDESDIPPGR